MRRWREVGSLGWCHIAGQDVPGLCRQARVLARCPPPSRHPALLPAQVPPTQTSSAASRLTTDAAAPPQLPTAWPLLPRACICLQPVMPDAIPIWLVPCLALALPALVILGLHIAGRVSRREAHHACLSLFACVALTGMLSNLLKSQASIILHHRACPAADWLREREKGGETEAGNVTTHPAVLPAQCPPITHPHTSHISSPTRPIGSITCVHQPADGGVDVAGGPPPPRLHVPLLALWRGAGVEPRGRPPVRGGGPACSAEDRDEEFPFG